MQMAAAYSAIADGGVLRPPQLILDRGETPASEPAGRRVISARTAAALRQMLVGVLAPGGTASEVSVPGYTLAGKTGTSQVAVDGGYSDSRFIASFVGFAPAELILDCWSPSSSTSPRAATTTVAPSPPPRSARSQSSRFPIWRSRRIRAERPRQRPRIAAMELRELLAGTDVAEIAGNLDTQVSGLAYDSRRVKPGTLFFCVRGQRSDGHEFAGDAAASGASSLVVERLLDLPVAQVRVADARAAMPTIAVRFFGDPTASLRVAGITGTNGKTTTAFLIRHVLEAQGTRTGLLGTVKQVVGGVDEEVERTTPEAIDLQATFRRMLDAGDRACPMEVSSHALALGRTAGVRFAVAVFTNLTQDHLDFHQDMEDYFLAKRGLFLPSRGASQPAPAVVNVDDAYGARLAEELRESGHGRLLTLSPSGARGADFRALDASFDSSGSRFRCLGPDGEVAVRTQLPGHFNVENTLAALAACHVLGVSTEAAAAALASARGVPGRFEPVDAGQPFAVLVDYAHTPDSLENVLRAARRLTPGRLLVVFGCGGDRDREKRPLMGEIAARLSDACFITSDNPRSEDPEAIIDEILAGVPRPADGLRVQADRRAAIALALGEAASADTVLIAGKGHEQGQELAGGRKIPFDDREVAIEELRALHAGSEA